MLQVIHFHNLLMFTVCLQHIEFNDVWSDYQQAFDTGRLTIPIQLKTTFSTEAASAISRSPKQGEPSLCSIEVSQTEEAVVELTACIPQGDNNVLQENNICKKVT